LEAPVLLYDGWCRLCSWSVRFILRHESAPTFRFAPLDSETGRSYFGIMQKAQRSVPDSIVVITAVEPVSVLTGGRAVLYILDYMKHPWRDLRIFRILPDKLLDGIYDFIAGHRYRIWGKNDKCLIPDEIKNERTAAPRIQAESEK